jgi:hypothetical protein
VPSTLESHLQCQHDEPEDLDRLVGELGVWPAPDSNVLDQWLRILVDREAGDLFLVAGFPPAIRLHGVVTPLKGGPLDGDDIEIAILPSLHAHALKAYKTSGSADVSLRREGFGRFRLNLHRERGRFQCRCLLSTHAWLMFSLLLNKDWHPERTCWWRIPNCAANAPKTNSHRR